jgi:hypothetical protein
MDVHSRVGAQYPSGSPSANDASKTAQQNALNALKIDGGTTTPSNRTSSLEVAAVLRGANEN